MAAEVLTLPGVDQLLKVNDNTVCSLAQKGFLGDVEVA